MKKIFVNLFIFSLLFGLEESAFLKIEPSVRIAGLGTIGCASARGISEVFLNPAGLTGIKRISLSANYTRWYAGVGYGSFGFAIRQIKKEEKKLSRNIFGFSIIGMNVEGIEKRNADGELLGTFGSSTYALALSYSRVLYKGISGGLNVKYIYNNIDGDVAYGFAMDGGLLYWPTDFYGLGISIKNLGSGLQSKTQNALTKTDFSFPTEIRGGASYIFPMGTATVTSNLDISISLTGNPASLGFSTEIDLMKTLYLRGGVIKAFGDKVIQNGTYTTVSENTLSFGAGFSLRYEAWSLDYAFYSRNDFIKPHRIGITINF